MSLAGMHHQKAEIARGIQYGCDRPHRALKLRDVIAERLPEAARIDEIALHVDDEKRRRRPVQIDRFGLRGDGTGGQLSWDRHGVRTPRERTSRMRTKQSACHCVQWLRAMARSKIAHLFSALEFQWEFAL